MGMFSFLSRWMASSDDRSPWGDFWFEPVTVRTSSGMRVSADNALRLAAVYASVRILAETMASLPFVLYRQRADGGKDRVTDHWLYRLLAKRPNRHQNPYEWRCGAMPTTGSWPTAEAKSWNWFRSTRTGSRWNSPLPVTTATG